MEHLGNNTKSIFLVGPEAHKLSLEFESVGDIGVITLSADLAASDDINGKINGTAIDKVSYTGSHAATMGLLKTAVEEIAGVEAAFINGKVLTFVMANSTASIVLSDFVVTNGGAGTATVTTSITTTTMAPGTPVILTGAGEKIAPANMFASFGLANAEVNAIGVSLHGTHNIYKDGLVTVFVKGYIVTFGQCSSAVSVGPVSHDGVDLTTGYNKYKTSTANNIIGMALDAGADEDVIRILLMK